MTQPITPPLNTQPVEPDKRELLLAAAAALENDTKTLRPSADSASAEVVKEFKSPLGNVPWTLEQFFKGSIDLDQELISRFPNMPLMLTFKSRSMGSNTRRGVATLSNQDGSAMLMADVNGETGTVQFSYTFGSMLTLRFVLDDLSDMDRGRWLELMQRKQGGLTFLWGQARWQHDYMICIRRQHYTSLMAYSKNNFEAAVRMTPEVTRELIKWLGEFWKPGGTSTNTNMPTKPLAASKKPTAPDEDTPPPLLTW